MSAPTMYLLTIKQREEEDLKTYLTHFNKERLTIDDQDEKITLATLLDRIWLRCPFMAELARKIPSTLRKFMDGANDFVNAEDPKQALTDSRKGEHKAEREKPT
ncbi:hypothetical protein I3843_13G000400 [Carya illinoinensis]|uniref:Retrotransposon gag domain-containing protein n=1 Tax=Carya illinoinensis TaxID=32201 RepID=A0A922D513_CARIL|nr:hypothetical protein I3842_13G000300 [Carya illinoinensis]KAG7948221.1 hypothetical protein I3843_13G000400 [Carya illinoinensis]